jgi:hypothetical protein
MKLNKEQVLSIIRYVLTAVGIILVTKGVTDDGTYTIITGAVLSAVSGIWSVLDKTDANMQKKFIAFQAKAKK